MEATGWREGLGQEIVYKRKFAFFKTACASETVWLSWYYSKYCIWKDTHQYTGMLKEYGHTDFVGNITEADFIVEKLTNL